MDLSLLVQCLVGKHHRDGHKAIRRPDGQYVSVCKGCGRAMYKANGRWKTGKPG